MNDLKFTHFSALLLDTTSAGSRWTGRPLSTKVSSQRVSANVERATMASCADRIVRVARFVVTRALLPPRGLPPQVCVVTRPVFTPKRRTAGTERGESVARSYADQNTLFHAAPPSAVPRAAADGGPLPTPGADRQTDRQGRHFCRGGTSAGEALTAAYPQPPQVCSRIPLYGAVCGLSSVVWELCNNVNKEGYLMPTAHTASTGTR